MRERVASIYAYMDVCTCVKKSKLFLAKLALLVPCVSVYECVCVLVLVFCIESAVCSRMEDLVPSAQ